MRTNLLDKDENTAVEELVIFRIASKIIKYLPTIFKLARIPNGFQAYHATFFLDFILEGPVTLKTMDKPVAERPAISINAILGILEGSLMMRYHEMVQCKVFGFQFNPSDPASLFYDSGV